MIGSALIASPLRAQFSEPVALTSEGATPGSVEIATDFFGFLQLAYVADGELSLRTVLPGGHSQTTSIATDAEDPDLAFFSVGLFVAYSQEPEASAPDENAGELEGDRDFNVGDVLRPESDDDPPAPEARRVCYSTRLGQALNGPQCLSPPDLAARAPSIALDARARPFAAWESVDGDGAPEILFVRPDADPVSLGAGTAPALEIDRDGSLHIFFVRNDRLHYGRDVVDSETPFASGFASIAADIAAPHSAPSVGLLGNRDVYIAFESQGSIYLTDNARRASLEVGEPEGGEIPETHVLGFGEPRLLDPDGASSPPDLNATPGGLLAIAWEKDGDIYHVFGNAFSLSEPRRALETEADETNPSIATDDFANLYLTFERDGRLFITTTAGAPQARFRATPLTGELPLRVEFFDESIGDVTGWHWDFGDGTTSTAQNPVHIFEEPGDSIVTLRVDGPGGTSELEHRQAIRVTRPANEFWIGDVRAFVGQQDVYAPVVATHDQGAQGFQIAAVFDPAVIEVTDVGFAYTNLGGLGPELAEFHVSHDPEDPKIIAGVLFDIEPPFDSRILEPGINQRLVNIVLNIRPSAEPHSETEIRLVNGMGSPPRNNVITVRSRSVLPRLGKAGTIHIEPLEGPFPLFFVRGDVDDSREINLSDAVALLNFLFLGADLPGCPDAADATDDGRLDISDASFLLNFLFRAGSYPLPPYPRPGLDPTEDDFPDCLNG